MTCECLTWCRVPEEPNTYGGRYQMSEHHPNCPAYKDEEFTVLEYDGTRATCEPQDARDIIENEGGSTPYKISTVRLSRDQFEKLPDFEGF
jgi:hypothetical protein